MAIVPGFEYDVFISYRHNDNLDGWVTDFVQNLEKEIRSTLKDPLTIYFDKNPHDGLLETHDVNKSLEEKLKCLIFIPIISQTYCDPKSFAWQNEFCVFNKLAQQDQLGRDIRLSNGNVASRILPIKIHDLDADDKGAIENELGALLRAIEFIYKEPGVNRPLKATDPKGDNQNKTDYRNQVNKVANAIKEIILTLKNPDIQADRIAGTERPTVNQSGRNKKTLIGSLLFLLIATAGYFLYQQQVTQRKQPVQSDKSIAVLPFVDMSPGKEQEYLADGIAEEIITALSRIRDLKVIGRTSSFQFKGEKIDLRVVGEKLNVSTVLEGSIMKSGNKVRITAQLINVSDGMHIWSERYDRNMDDIFAIQDQISKAISDKMKISLLGKTQSNTDRRTTNTEAYENYLRGVQILLPGRGNDAMPFFKKAIELDSGYADAYGGLAWSYFFSWDGQETFDRVLQLAMKVRELDPGSDKSYALLYTIYGSNDNKWKWKIAKEEYQKYLSINPLPLIGHALDRAYIMGDVKGGIQELNQHLEVDPINKDVLRLMGTLLAYDGQYAKAEELINKAIEMDPTFYAAYHNLAEVNIMAGKYDNALTTLAKFDELSKHKYSTKELRLWALTKAGRLAEANKVYATRDLSNDGSEPFLSPSSKARIEFWMGHEDEGFQWLEEALKQKDSGILSVRFDPTYDVNRNHSRFKEFMKKVPFPPNDY